MESNPAILTIDLGRFHSVLGKFDAKSNPEEIQRYPTLPDPLRGIPFSRVVRKPWPKGV